MKKILISRVILYKISVLLIYLLIQSLSVNGQKSDNAVKQNTTPVFMDGVYFSSSDFIRKQPSVTSAQLLNGKQKTIKNWFKNDSLFYSTANNSKSYLPFEKVWGYFEGNTLYVQRNGFAHKVHVLGTLSLFNESYPIVKAPFNPVAIEESKEIKLRMLDLQNGKILEYSLKTFTSFLKQYDSELLKEYMSVGGAKLRRQLMIKYIDKFNDRHPLS